MVVAQGPEQVPINLAGQSIVADHQSDPTECNPVLSLHHYTIVTNRMRTRDALRAAADHLHSVLLQKLVKQVPAFGKFSDWTCSRSPSSSVISLRKEIEERQLNLFVRASPCEKLELSEKSKTPVYFEASTEFLLCIGKTDAESVLAIEGAALQGFLDLTSFSIIEKSKMASISSTFNRRQTAGQYRGPLFPTVGHSLRLAFIDYLEGLGVTDGLADVILQAAEEHQAGLCSDLFRNLASELEP